MGVYSHVDFVRESRVSRQVCGRALLIYRALNYREKREGGLEIENSLVYKSCSKVV